MSKLYDRDECLYRMAFLVLSGTILFHGDGHIMNSHIKFSDIGFSFYRKEYRLLLYRIRIPKLS